MIAMKIARERKSSILASNAVHHRVDSLTGIVALVAICGSHFIQNASWLDPVGGFLVSLMVIKAGWANTGSALLELADVGVEDEIRSAVRKAASQGLKDTRYHAGGQVVINNVQGTKSGPNYLMDLELAVPKSWTVEQVREIEESVREQVGTKVRGARRVRIRFVPKDALGEDKSDFVDEFIPADVSQRSSPEPEDDEDDHNHGHHGHSHVNGARDKRGKTSKVI